MTKLSAKKNFKVSRIKRGTFVLPKFANSVHKIISSKYENTYVVGGAVRNFSLQKKITDVDFATSATPLQVIKVLEVHKILYSDEHAKFGIIIARQGKQKVEIATLRTEKYTKTRFPKVAFTRSLGKDSKRRDFTINALYFSPQSSQVLDFYNGLKDIKRKIIKFIGNPNKRIQEDPLRIIRAYKFALQYNLKIENKSAVAIKNNLRLLKNISKMRVQKEIQSLKQKNLQKRLQKVIHSIS